MNNQWKRFHALIAAWRRSKHIKRFGTVLSGIVVLKVMIDMEGHNTWTTLDSSIVATQTKPNLYVISGWLQEATIKVTALDDTKSSYALLIADHFIHNNDTTDASVAYKIINGADYELPSTGVPGMYFFTLLGIMLTSLMGAGLLLMRKKRGNVA